jgi:DNA helicase-2/ATP-dependent DNA helicase PcrA
MRRLYLTRAIRRSFWGGNSEYQMASRFIGEIPQALLSVTRQGAAGGAGRPTPAGGGRSWDTGSSGRQYSSPGFSASRRPETPAAPAITTSSPWPATRPTEESASQGISGEPVTLTPGDRVLHRLFGEGTVLRVIQEKGTTSAEVLFVKAGKKTLDLAFANLQKI